MNLFRKHDRHKNIFLENIPGPCSEAIKNVTTLNISSALLTE
jgi:hypothetical protein